MASNPRQRGPTQFASPFCSWCPGKNGCEVCCLATFCPCVQFGYNAELLRAEDVACGASCLPAGLMHLGLMCGVPLVTGGLVPCGCAWILHMRAREVIRRKYNLEPEPCNDFCTVFFCPACALCQEHYQLTGPHNAGLPTPPPPVLMPPQYHPAPPPPPSTAALGGLVYGTPVAPPPPSYPPIAPSEAYTPYYVGPPPHPYPSAPAPAYPPNPAGPTVPRPTAPRPTSRPYPHYPAPHQPGAYAPPQARKA